jgi:hypothetical protein
VAREIRTFQVTIPAGTAKASPVTVAINFPPRTVVQLDWQVPDGPAGLMGWALTVSGQPVIPRNSGAYIIANDVARSWPLEGYPDQGQWQVTGYNTDIYDHSVYFDFLLELNGTASPQPVQLPSAAISTMPPAGLLALPTIPVPQLAGV